MFAAISPSDAADMPLLLPLMLAICPRAAAADSGAIIWLRRRHARRYIISVHMARCHYVAAIFAFRFSPLMPSFVDIHIVMLTPLAIIDASATTLIFLSAHTPPCAAAG